MFYRINFYENSTLLKVELTQTISLFDIEFICSLLFANNSAKESIFIEIREYYFNNRGQCNVKMKNGKFAYNKSAKVTKDFFNIENRKLNIINHIELK